MSLIDPERSLFIQEVKLDSTKEAVEIHRCPHCKGVLGIDTSYLDQVAVIIKCPMCEQDFKAEDPTED